MIEEPIEEYSPIIWVAIAVTIADACLYLFLSEHGFITSGKGKIALGAIFVFSLLLCFFLGWLYDKIHNNRVENVIQCLPKTVDDWKKYDVHTNEEAIQTLRELVHGFGYSWRILYDEKTMFKIASSYNAYLDFMYGENEDAKAWNKIIDNNPGYHDVILVICPDKKFDNKLKLALERRKEKRQNWCKREYDASVLETLEATEDTSL